jgi:RNA polymerase sigma-70 factor (ECF subfamily)
LAERLAREGVDALAPVVERSTPRLFRAAMRLLGRRAEAEDAVQEAFVRALRALQAGRYEERLRLEAWLVTIVTRVAIDMRRRERRRPTTEAEEAAVHDGGAGGERLARALELARWLDALPPEQREAVVLKYFEGFTSAEVGVALGVSEGAIEQRLLRARATLRRRLDDDGSR